MTPQEIYSPAKLHEALELITSKMVAHLEAAQSSFRSPLPEPHKLTADLAKLLERPDENTSRRLAEILSGFLEHSRQLQSPHYIGHQVASPVPWAAALDGVASIMNQGVGVFEMGPYSNAIERSVCALLASFISRDAKFEGVVTNGGTLANLTALLAARNNRYETSFNDGLGNREKKPAVIASSEAHYSVTRALGVMGLGSAQVLKAPVDPKTRRINNALMVEFYQQKIKEGYDIFAVIGSACSTPTGAIDDLEFLGSFCKKNKLWFHVDAAHGGGFLLSPKLRPKFKGIESADSVVWDAHKMMFVPALCTFVFFKDKKHSYTTFSQDAPYLFDSKSSEIDYESGLRTFECTKGTLILPLFAVLTTLGVQGISTLNEGLVEMTSIFSRMLKESGEYEVLHEPQANILCFRYVKGIAEAALNDVQDKIRNALIKEGDFYITATTLDGKRCLRVTVMNPLTGSEDFKMLMQKIGQFATGK